MEHLFRCLRYGLVCGFFASTPAMADQTCELLTDFSTDEQNRYWRTINDNVMGGRSVGGPSFESGIMTFSGATNTDGGGFSSIRARLSQGRLDGYKSLKIKARADDRQFKLTTEDDKGGRRMRLAHRMILPLQADKDWQEIAVDFEDLTPTYFDQPVNAAPFSPARARSIGIIIYDKKDGPFELQLDWIKICK